MTDGSKLARRAMAAGLAVLALGAVRAHPAAAVPHVPPIAIHASLRAPYGSPEARQNLVVDWADTMLPALGLPCRVRG